MIILPAIDLYEGKAVRLFKGNYAEMTVYSEDPLSVAQDFKRQGATSIHLVDLEGAKNGTTPNFDIVCAIKQSTGLICEIGGGIRSLDTVKKYIDNGIDRVILGTSAVKDRAFVTEAVEQYGEKIAIGIDIKDNKVAIKGWTEVSDLDAFDFCEDMQNIGVKTIICTDISRDGAMQGTNRQLYKTLTDDLDIRIIASGGVSSIEDVVALRDLGVYGAIIGKAYYTGAVCLRDAIEVAK